MAKFPPIFLKECFYHENQTLVWVRVCVLGKGRAWYTHPVSRHYSAHRLVVLRNPGVSKDKTEDAKRILMTEWKCLCRPSFERWLFDVLSGGGGFETRKTRKFWASSSTAHVPESRWANHKHEAQVWLLYLLTWPDLIMRDVVDCKRFELGVLTGACFASSVAETPMTTNTPGISVLYAS